METACPECGKLFGAEEGSEGAVCPHCGHDLTAEATARTVKIPPPGAQETLATRPPKPSPGTEAEAGGRSFSRYRILGELGRGGMGIVYKTYDPKLKRIVALKVLLSGEAASGEEVERFFREAESAAKLHHPNIVPIHELDIHEGKHFFTMDFVEGRPLSKVIRDGDATPRRAVEIIRDVALAVHHAHEQGVIHRDLKPANILLTEDARPMVTDFGLAKQVQTDSSLTQSGSALGTPSYMAPEQALGLIEEIDARTDVYALGVVLYEMVAGMPPFVGATPFEIMEKVAYEDPSPPRTFNKACPLDVETICLKCLEKDRKRRYESAAELGEDCRRFLDGEAITARPASVIYRVRKKLARHRAVAGVIATAVAVIFGLTVWYVVSLLGALVEARRERDRADAERRVAEEQRQATEVARREEAVQRREAEAAREREEAQRTNAEFAARKAEATTAFLLGMLQSVRPQQQGREVKVSELLDKAEGKIAKDFADQPTVRASLHSAVGITYAHLGKYDRAELHLRAAAADAAEVMGDGHPAALKALNNVANILAYRGKHQEAEEISRRVLKSLQEVLPTDHPDLLNSMHGLANLLSRRGKLDEAELLFRKVLEAQQRVLGPEHPHTLTSTGNLATLLVMRGNLEEAEDLSRKALEVAKRLLGEEHLQTFRYMNTLGKILLDRGEAVRAEALHRRALEGRRRLLGAEHPETLDSMDSLSSALSKQGRLDEAETLRRASLEARRRVLGGAHPGTLSTMRGLAVILEAQGKGAEAEELRDAAARAKSEHAEGNDEQFKDGKFKGEQF